MTQVFFKIKNFMCKESNPYHECNNRNYQRGCDHDVQIDCQKDHKYQIVNNSSHKTRLVSCIYDHFIIVKLLNK